MSTSDQRKMPRVEINHEFHSVAEFIDEYVANISRTGVFIQSKDPLAIGTRVRLKFTLLLEEIETIEGEGEVVRVERGRKSGMGVVFTHLTQFSMALLDRIFTQTHAAPLPASSEPKAPMPAGRIARKATPPVEALTNGAKKKAPKKR